MRAPRRPIVTVAAGAPAVAGGRMLADAQDGGGQDGDRGEYHGNRHGRHDRGRHTGNAVLRSTLATMYCGGTAVGTTAPVAFSPGGDARIDQTLATAPRPWLAPALLINPAPAGSAVTGTYIAASGA
jgi:hypothetical protein